MGRFLVGLTGWGISFGRADDSRKSSAVRSSALQIYEKFLKIDLAEAESGSNGLPDKVNPSPDSLTLSGSCFPSLSSLMKWRCALDLLD